MIYNGLKQSIKQIIDHTKKLPENENFTARDRYNTVEGMLTILNFIKDEEEFVRDEIPYETLEATLEHLKDILTYDDVMDLVNATYEEEDYE